MLALFKKQKVEEKDQFQGMKTRERKLRQAEVLEASEETPIVQELQRVREGIVDEDALKKSIESKLKKYRPVEREANFTGPKYYR